MNLTARGGVVHGKYWREKREVGGMIFYYNCKNQKVIIKKVRKLAQVVTLGAE